jgi:hypothetical protein
LFLPSEFWQSILELREKIAPPETLGEASSWQANQT